MSEKLYLQAVIIKKPMEFAEAYKMAQSVIRNKKKSFVRETEQSYRFRNIPKPQFKPDSFITKKINENMSLVFGHLY